MSSHDYQGGQNKAEIGGTFQVSLMKFKSSANVREQ